MLLFIGSLAQQSASAQGQYPPYPNQVLQHNGPYPQPVGPVGGVGFNPQAQGAVYPQGSQGMQPAQAFNRPATNIQQIQDWFQRYDQVRRRAQMNPQERKKADEHLSKGLSMFIPGDEKVAVQKLLNSLVARYSVASDAMKQLPLYPETAHLHRGYYQYFVTARALFNDYLRVQANPLVQDNAGNAIAGTLLPRKQDLEMLDQNNKALDAQLRNQFGIPPYKY